MTRSTSYLILILQEGNNKDIDILEELGDAGYTTGFRF